MADPTPSHNDIPEIPPQPKRWRAVAGGGASVAGDDVHSTGWKMFRPVWQPASGGFLFPVSPLFVFIIIIDIYLYND